MACDLDRVAMELSEWAATGGSSTEWESHLDECPGCKRAWERGLKTLEQAARTDTAGASTGGHEASRRL